MRALDEHGAPFELEAEGLLAVCIQHEMDHLEGRVFVEKLSRLKRSRILAKIKKRQREAALTSGAATTDDTTDMRLIFAGTPEFAAVALEALIDAGHDIVLVLTQPDRPAGTRASRLKPSAVKKLCAKTTAYNGATTHSKNTDAAARL